MKFISYAQNFEDVMLWRALKDVENGFYIDIGANDPVEYSVTKAMYDLGWKGINVEPVQYWFDKLEESRKRDVNLQLAIGSSDATLKFFEVLDTGLSTLDEKIAMEHAKNLGFEIKDYLVPCKTLTQVCHEEKVNDIHFLKIDVEGAEKLVLKGINFTKVRPWIIVIEATKPMSQDVDYASWEYLIVDNNYHFVYFDGLNRYYIANEHSELDSSFNTPPNVFDEIVLCENHHLSSLSKVKASEAEAKASEAEAKASEAEAKANEAEAKASEAEAKASEAEAKASEAEAKASEAEVRTNDALNHYHMVVNSSSWKITYPFREIGQLARNYFQRIKN